MPAAWLRGAAESQFTTVATVAQETQYGDRLLTAGVLDFEGVEYVSPPETRPYYLARTMEASGNNAYFQIYAESVHIVEFTCIDDSISKSKLEPMKVRIEKVHYESFIGLDWHERRLAPGDEVYIIQTYANVPIMFRAGTRYMGDRSYQRYESSETGLDISIPSTRHTLPCMTLPRFKRQKTPSSRKPPSPGIDATRSPRISGSPEAEDTALATMETACFSRDYSLWEESDNSEADIVLDETALTLQGALRAAVPAGLFLIHFLLAVGMVDRNLRIEPILLLGGQGE